MLARFCDVPPIAIGAPLQGLRRMIASAAAMCAAGHVAAQCQPAWLLPITGDAYTPGPNTETITTWDPDGSGPRPELLVFGGRMRGAGSTAVEGIALFDGTTWSGLPKVYSRDVCGVGNDRGTLVAFSPEGNIHQTGIPFRWNGTTWELMQAADLGRAVGFSVVRDEFWCASAKRVWRWDGSIWNDEGSAIADERQPAQIIEFKGNIYAIGNSWGSNQANQSSRGIAVKQGTAWLPVGGALNGDLNTAAALWRDQIVVAGALSFAPGTLRGLLTFDGTQWRVLDSTHEGATSMVVHRDELIAISGGGSFGNAQGDAGRYIARFDGAAWHALGDGISSYGSRLGIDPNGDLIVTGTFTRAGNSAVRGLARWDGAAWHSPLKGFNGPIGSVAAIGKDLFVGGTFTGADGVPAENIARWNGSAWSALGTEGPQRISALLAHDGALYAVGSEGTRIGRWNDYSWTTIGTGGTDGTVLAEFGGEVLVGGAFPSTAGISTVSRIGRVVNDQIVAINDGLNGDVWAMTTFNGSLIAGGAFTNAAGVAAPASVAHVARWDGTRFVPLGAGVNGPVYALTLLDDKLIIGGQFGIAGGFPNGVAAPSIAMWDGSTFAPIGDGLDGRVNGLLVVGGMLYATGNFTKSGTRSISGIARWDGTAWQPVESGLSRISGSAATGYALAPYGDAIVVAGDFDTVGGAIPASNVALLGRTCPPCAADFNDDGEVTFEDFDAFVGLLESGSGTADMNNDGFLSFEDFDAFVAAFEGGC